MTSCSNLRRVYGERFETREERRDNESNGFLNWSQNYKHKNTQFKYYVAETIL